jgi:hypothetical protein
MKLAGTYDGKGDEARAAATHDSHERPAPPEAGDADELTKVRALLFGASLEEMREEIDRLSSREAGGNVGETLDRRIAAFEKSIQKKLDKLASRITTEADQRLEGHTRAQQRLDEQKHTLELALDEIGSRIEEGSTSLAAQLHGQSRLMSDSIRRTAEQLSGHFEREFEVKSWARGDRRALAKVVHELAMQLENDEA